jgi:hypothetical protein
MEDAHIAVVAAAGAPAGAADPSRRSGLRLPDGSVRFAGLGSEEAEEVRGALARGGPDLWDRALVEVTLPVVLSDGAGPHLIDGAGRLVLALADHPHMHGTRVAMAPAGRGFEVGLVRRAAGPRLWEWAGRTRVAADRQVAALDALDAVADGAALRAWERDGWGSAEADAA